MRSKLVTQTFGLEIMSACVLSVMNDCEWFTNQTKQFAD